MNVKCVGKRFRLHVMRQLYVISSLFISDFIDEIINEEKISHGGMKMCIDDVKMMENEYNSINLPKNET